MPFHVINRAARKLRIFKKDEDYALFLELLADDIQKTGMKVLAFMIMPDHWHLVLFSEKAGGMKVFMHLLTNAHTRKVHTRTKTTGAGPLYQGRYKSFIIQSGAHLRTVIKYVERNPVRAGLVKKAEDWRWGSAWIRLKGTEKQKRLLSKRPVRLPKKYRAWVNAPEREETIERLRTSVNKGTPFGEDEWVHAMAETYGLGATLRGTGRPKGSKNR